MRSSLGRARTRLRALVNRLRWRPYHEPTPSLTLRTIDTFDERADALWDRCRDAFEFAVIRDREYLNWRYCDPRAGIYRVRVAEDGDTQVGFVVTTTFDRETRIVDLLAAPEDTGTLRVLIEDALTTAHEQSAAGISVLMPRTHPYREPFRRYGFIDGSRMWNMGFNNRNLWLLKFMADEPAARFHVAYGDSDHM